MPETIIRLSDRDRALIAAAAAEIIHVLLSAQLDATVDEHRAWAIEKSEAIRSRLLAAGDPEAPAAGRS